MSKVASIYCKDLTRRLDFTQRSGVHSNPQILATQRALAPVCNYTDTYTYTRSHQDTFGDFIFAGGDTKATLAPVLPWDSNFSTVCVIAPGGTLPPQTRAVFVKANLNSDRLSRADVCINLDDKHQHRREARPSHCSLPSFLQTPSHPTTLISMPTNRPTGHRIKPLLAFPACGMEPQNRS